MSGVRGGHEKTNTPKELGVKIVNKKYKIDSRALEFDLFCNYFLNVSTSINTFMSLGKSYLQKPNNCKLFITSFSNVSEISDSEVMIKFLFIMKKWTEEMFQAFVQQNTTKIRNLLKLGFPIETSVSVSLNNSEKRVKKTFCAHLCCEFDLIEILNELVKIGCNLESKDSDLMTPLMVACEFGRIEIVRFLILKCSANLLHFNFFGHNVVHISALSGNLDILRFLIEEIGINNNVKSTYHKTALEICREIYIKDFNSNLEKIISYLIAKNSQNFYQYPLKTICENNSNYNSHDYCKNQYSLSLITRKKGKRLRKIEKNTQKKRFSSPTHLSVDRFVNVKCAMIYKNMLNSQILKLPKIISQGKKSLHTEIGFSPILSSDIN